MGTKMSKHFFNTLKAAIEENNSLLCVGLDPRPERIPERDVLAFNQQTVDATADLVCAF